MKKLIILLLLVIHCSAANSSDDLINCHDGEVYNGICWDVDTLQEVIDDNVNRSYIIEIENDNSSGIYKLSDQTLDDLYHDDKLEVERQQVIKVQE